MKQEIETLDALKTMREEFRRAEENEHENRVRALAALKFFWGEQWADEIERQRSADGKPCFTLNKLPAILRQIINECEQNPPAIEISPVADGADEEKAEARQGLCRHVEQQGQGGELAYFRAFLYMIVGGFGSWRILHDYLPMSFDQDLYLEPVKNPFSVYWDPAAQKLDKSDARFCFITKDLSADAYREQYPKSELASLTDFSGLGDRAPGWLTHDGVRVVEYFRIESEDSELVKLADGRAVWADEKPKGAKVVATRTEKRRRAYRAVSNGVEWLEPKTELPVDEIPVITVTAEELDIDGETRIKGAVFDLEQAQRLFNFNSSAIAETMALGSKANWIATIEQIEEFRSIWQQSNRRNIAVLPYKNVAGAPPPQKIASEPPIQAMSEARLQSADDLRSISGVYDATQSPNGGEESGRAILARRRQTSTGNSHYLKSLARGVRRTGQILMKFFPKIYDTPRIVRILGSDLQAATVMVHAGQADAVPDAAFLPEGIKGVFDLEVGTYDVTVSVGPSYETKRKETLDMLLALCESNPAVVPIIGDLVVNQMDFAGKQAIVERLQRALPPQLQDQGNSTDPAALASHNSQLMAQNQQLMQQVQKITQILQTKQVEQQGRLQVESMKLQAAQVRADAGLEQERIKAGASILRDSAGRQFDAVHDHAMSSRQMTHDAAMSQLDQIHSMMSAQYAAALAPPAPVPGQGD